MATERKHYSRYFYNRDLQTLWKGDASEAGSQYRSIAIATSQLNSIVGVFQVLALEGVGKGIRDGEFVGGDDNPKVLFDKDFDGLDAAADEFHKLLKDAEANGFQSMTFWGNIEYEQKLRASKRA